MIQLGLREHAIHLHKMGKSLSFVLLLLGAVSASSTVMAADSELLRQLRADHAALKRAEAEFDRLRRTGGMGEAEQMDFSAWIDRLRDRLWRDCQAAQGQTGTPLPDDLPCRHVAAGNPSPAAIDIARESTRAEQATRLVEQLEGSLGEFDERLLREQERVRARTPHSSDTGSGGGGGSRGGERGAGSGDDAAADGADGDQADMETARGREVAGDGGAESSGSTEQGVSGKPMPGTGSSAPDDIPDGSDDDVIARQLREAAEKETDPELKKKLWEEYRRYKQGVKGQ